jgi:hypothetical protein
MSPGDTRHAAASAHGGRAAGGCHCLVEHQQAMAVGPRDERDGARRHVARRTGVDEAQPPRPECRHANIGGADTQGDRPRVRREPPPARVDHAEALTRIRGVFPARGLARKRGHDAHRRREHDRQHAERHDRLDEREPAVTHAPPPSRA